MFKRFALVVAAALFAVTGLAMAQGPIKIGISLPLTGMFSQPGGAAQKGYQVWAKIVNDNGGLLGRQVQLVIKDDASDQNTIVSDYNRLITQDKVDLVLGTFSSLLNLPASAVAEKYHMLYVEPAGGAPKMFDRGFQYLFFAQQATANHQGDQFVKWVLSLPADQRPKTAAYPTQDDPFTKPVIEGIRTQLEAAGIKTVYQTTYPPDTSNFDTIASAIKNSGAELVAEGAVFQDGVSIIRSFQKLGYSPKVLFETSAPSESEQFSSGIGMANTEGIFYAVSWNSQLPTTMNKQFVDTYQQMFGAGQIPAEDAADAFATAQVMQKAVEAVGSLDQAKLKDWLHANSVDTILGNLSWDKTGAPQSAFLLAQWQKGKAEIVLPRDVATSPTITYPKPGWQ